LAKTPRYTDECALLNPLVPTARQKTANFQAHNHRTSAPGIHKVMQTFPDNHQANSPKKSLYGEAFYHYNLIYGHWYRYKRYIRLSIFGSGTGFEPATFSGCAGLKAEPDSGPIYNIFYSVGSGDRI